MTCREWKYTSDSGQTFTLVDTPGFDDLNRPDVSVLKSIVDYLRYNAHLQVLSIIYLHRITENRITGSSRLSLRMFQDFCGECFYQNIVLATTMWGVVPEKLLPDLARREKELNDSNVFWGYMILRDATYKRYLRTVESGKAILDVCTSKRNPPQLKIFLEMKLGCDLESTSAGQTMTAEIRKREEEMRQELQEELEEAKSKTKILEAKKGAQAAQLDDRQHRVESEQQELESTGQGHGSHIEADRDLSGHYQVVRHAPHSRRKNKAGDTPGEGRSSRSFGFFPKLGARNDH